jgi:hypothetical protein
MEVAASKARAVSRERRKKAAGYVSRGRARSSAGRMNRSVVAPKRRQDEPSGRKWSQGRPYMSSSIGRDDQWLMIERASMGEIPMRGSVSAVERM